MHILHKNTIEFMLVGSQKTWTKFVYLTLCHYLSSMKRKINITIDKEVHDKLAAEAKKDSRSRSSLINKILRKFFGIDKDETKASN